MSVRGFSLLEMMIGMVILMIAMMGFTSMIAMQAQSNKVSRGTDEAATLAQAAVEAYSNVQFSTLGTDLTMPCDSGLSNGDICTEGPLNRLGLTTGNGPFIYYRSIVVCGSSDTVPTGSNPTYCGSNLSGAGRPSELACSGLALTSREKMIRVLVAWSDKYGRCHYIKTNSLSFNWSGT